VRYALLVYRAPGAAAPGDRPTEADGRAGDGVFDDWVAYTRAVKRAGGWSGRNSSKWSTRPPACGCVRVSGC
jgi:hypothetical protein